MIHTVRVTFKNKEDDLLSKSILGEINNRFKYLKITDIQIARVYRLEGINNKETKILQEKLFCEHINQLSCVDGLILKKPNTLVEIGYKPGVMNPEVASILKSAKDLKINLLAADSSTEYGFYGKISKQDVDDIINKLNLFNKTVEHIVENEPKTLLITGIPGKTNIVSIRNMSDENLMLLSKDKLFLNLEEMKIIQKYFEKIGRDPTDCELETLAQTWSEHSGHKTFKAKIIVDGKEKLPLITRLKKEALKHNKNIVSAFVDNSGAMDFYDGFAISGKGETHNAPSAIEPYGGAMTGSGGVFRDIVGTGQGGRTLASTDIFCFAPWNFPTNKLPPGTLPPQYLLKQVVTGVKDYGNRIGIPTNNGSVHFHEDFRARPTVLVGAYGIMPKKYAKQGTPKRGDVILVLGGRTGRDGIHGATFSSGEMTEQTNHVNVSAVQIGNAIEEKRVFDAIIESRDKGLIHAMQDVGGGGFSSAIGEIGRETGVTIDLKKAPLKYPGLSPWEIWISESQERMIITTDKKNLRKLFAICKKYNVEITNLGHFDGSKKLNVFYGKEKVCDMDMNFLHHGLPQRKMKAKRPTRHSGKSRKAGRLQNLDSGQARMTKLKNEKEWIHALTQVLSHGNVCSKEPIVRLYDHSVQGTNDLQPYSGVRLDGPNDAVVIRPLLNKPYGMVLSHGLNPILNKIDPYWGSVWAATEALSNYVAVGGDYRQASLINNYVWPFPDEEALWSLDKSVDAVVDVMRIFKIPVISGKDSLSSTYRGKNNTIIKIPPVLCISVFGRIPDTKKTITSDFKKENSVICLVGKLDTTTLGGSVYYQTRGLTGSSIPKIDLSILPKTLQTITEAIQNKKILSCHDVSEGGIITSVFEMCVGGNMGAEIHLGGVYSATPEVGLRLRRTSGVKVRPDHFLFNETAGCFIVEVESIEMAKKLFNNVPYVIIGKIQSEKNIDVYYKKKILFKTKLETLKKAWKKPMQELFS